MAKNVSRRCSMCSIEWPDKKSKYEKCPLCGEDTWRHKDGDPISEEEASDLSGDTPILQVETRTDQDYSLKRKSKSLDDEELLRGFTDWLDTDPDWDSL